MMHVMVVYEASELLCRRWRNSYKGIDPTCSSIVPVVINWYSVDEGLMLKSPYRSKSVGRFSEGTDVMMTMHTLMKMHIANHHFQLKTERMRQRYRENETPVTDHIDIRILPREPLHVLCR